MFCLVLLLSFVYGLLGSLTSLIVCLLGEILDSCFSALFCLFLFFVFFTPFVWNVMYGVYQKVQRIKKKKSNQIGLKWKCAIKLHFFS